MEFSFTSPFTPGHGPLNVPVVAASALGGAALHALFRPTTVDPEADRKATFPQPRIAATPPVSLRGRTIVITGATAGMGREAALQLLRMGASTLILGVRDTVRGERVRRDMLADGRVADLVATTSSGQLPDVKVFQLDLASYRSVTAFADRVSKEVPRLDLLLLNAGRNIAHFEKTEDGHEQLFQTNFLSNALLSLQLLPLLQKTSASLGPDAGYTPTITWVGSLAHNLHSLEKYAIPGGATVYQHFDDPANFCKVWRYCDTKLMVALFVREMARHVAGPDAKAGAPVVINNTCPGTVYTNFDRDLAWPVYLPMALNRYLTGRSVPEGARTLVHAAVVAGDKSHGAYIEHNKIGSLNPWTATKDGLRFEQMLWKESLAEFKKIDPRVSAGLS